MAKNGNVKFKRAEVERAEKIYVLISDALDGEIELKDTSKQAKYLPIPSSCKNASVNDASYKAYVTRAVYYNVTQPTRDALVGQLFLRAPVVEVPPELEPMINNINGEGLNLSQLVRKLANYVLPFGRAGLLADFPKTEGDVTIGQIKSGEIQPIIKLYEPWSIRNWLVQKVGNAKKLVLLVLDEAYETTPEANEFDIEIKIRQRVYRLINDECSVTVYEDEKQTSSHIVNGSDGNPLDVIPFEFVGSENNDAEVDSPPFYNLAILNLAHYRNSADYEESCFLLGQPTLATSGLTQEWVDMNFAGGITLGARGSIPLPEGGKAELLQVEPNTLAFEAMGHKEQQMISIGAKILKPTSNVERKQSEIEIEAASSRSILLTIKSNLELAMLACMKHAANFIGVDGEAIKLELNDNFDLQSMAPEQIRFLIELYKENTICFEEIRDNLLRSGLANLDLATVKTRLTEDKTMKDALVSELDKKAAEAKANPVGIPPVKKKKPSTK
jgi:hypothetical protein